MYWKARWKKNVNLDHLIRGLGILFGQRKGASRGASWKRGAGEPCPTPPIKTLTHESGGMAPVKVICTWPLTYAGIFLRTQPLQSYSRSTQSPVPTVSCEWYLPKKSAHPPLNIRRHIFANKARPGCNLSPKRPFPAGWPRQSNLHTALNIRRHIFGNTALAGL